MVNPAIAGMEDRDPEVMIVVLPMMLENPPLTTYLVQSLRDSKLHRWNITLD